MNTNINNIQNDQKNYSCSLTETLCNLVTIYLLLYLLLCICFTVEFSLLG